jgi:hypothetical protein
VHHHFDDDGQPDWAAPEHVDFKWNLLNLLHFPNVAGPNTFAACSDGPSIAGHEEFKRQYTYENAFAFGLTGVLMVFDFWTTLFFIVMPQLYGARSHPAHQPHPARSLRRHDRVEPLAQLRGPRLQLDHVQQRLPHDPPQPRGPALVGAGTRPTRER